MRLVALLLTSLLPAGGCGLLGEITQTGSIEVCNDDAGERIDSIEAVGIDCLDGLPDESDPPGTCRDDSDRDLRTGECESFSGLTPGEWTVYVTWTDGAEYAYDVVVSIGSTSDVSVVHGN